MQAQQDFPANSASTLTKMSLSANSNNIEKIDFLNKEEKMNSQVSDPKKDNFGSDEANTSSSNCNNYKDDSSCTDCEEDDLSGLEDFDSDDDDMLDQQYAFMSQFGSKSKTIKKHTINGKKNSSKFISTPQKFQIVNGEKFNLKLSNKVDNRLEMKNNRKQKIQEKTTFNFDVDEKSNNVLSKMLQNQALEKITGVIGKCKEFTIFHARIGPNFPSKPNLPKECVIKVYTPLFVVHPLQTRWRGPMPMGMPEKKISQTDAEDKAKNEFSILRKLTKANLPCQNGIMRTKNILFLSFIGKNTKLAQYLGALTLSDTECDIAYNQIIKAMRILFQELHLILVDLSPSNILWHNNECYFTDVNHIYCREVDAFKSLLSVCSRVESYFSGLQVTSNEIFKFVTDCEYGDRMSLEILQKLKA